MKKFLFCLYSTVTYWLICFLGPAAILLLNNIGYYVSGAGWGPDSLMYKLLQLLSQPLACAVAYHAAKTVCKCHSRYCVPVNSLVSAFACIVFFINATTVALEFSMILSSLVCIALVFMDMELISIAKQLAKSACETIRRKKFAILILTVTLCFAACVFVLRGTGNDDPGTTEPTEPETFVEEIAAPDPEEPSRKIYDYLPDGTPVYEDQIYIPEPYYFDEEGIKYVLEDGTYDQYYIEEDYEEVVFTPESTAFLEISYVPYFRELRVQFRNSGACYVYYDFCYGTWIRFKNAESKGEFFNEYIKGAYEYDKV